MMTFLEFWPSFLLGLVGIPVGLVCIMGAGSLAFRLGVTPSIAPFAAGCFCGSALSVAVLAYLVRYD